MSRSRMFEVTAFCSLTQFSFCSLPQFYFLSLKKLLLKLSLYLSMLAVYILQEIYVEQEAFIALCQIVPSVPSVFEGRLSVCVGSEPRCGWNHWNYALTQQRRPVILNGDIWESITSWNVYRQQDKTRQDNLYWLYSGGALPALRAGSKAPYL